jgi:site-specific recombinase XerC
MREYQKLMDTCSLPERPIRIRHKPITAELFSSLIATCAGTVRDRRDKALLHFAWNGGGLKAQEIVAARIHDLHDDGLEIHYCCKFAAPGKWGIRFQGLVRSYGGPAAEAIRDWLLCLATMNTKDGALWRSLFQDGSLRTTLTTNAIGQIVRDRARLAGLASNEFSSRSFAQGQIEALLADVPLKANGAERVREIPRSTVRSFIRRRRDRCDP